MRNPNLLAAKLLVLGSVMALSLTTAQAANDIWNGGTGGGNAGNLNRAQSWVGNALPGANTAQFSGITTNINPEFGNTTANWGGMLVSQTGNLTITSNAGSANTLTLGTAAGGSQTIISVSSGAGVVTIGSATAANAVNLATAAAVSGSTFTINNSSANTLTIDNGVAVDVASGTGTLAVTGTGTTVFNGVISGNHTANFSVASGSTATFAAANTYTGTTTVSGTLNLNIAGAISNSSSINLSGGSLVFGNVTDAVASGTNITSTGGTIDLTNFTSNGTSQTLGTLTLTSGVTTIDLGSKGTLILGSVVFSGGTLVIDGWTGFSGFAAVGSTAVQFGSNAAAVAFAGAASGDVTWTDATIFGTSAATYDNTAVDAFNPKEQVTPSGTAVTPIPEPSTVVFGLSLLALLAWGGRDKLIEAGRKLVRA